MMAIIANRLKCFFEKNQADYDQIMIAVSQEKDTVTLPFLNILSVYDRRFSEIY